MPIVRLDPAFAKTARKLLAKHPDKRKRVERAIAALEADPRSPGLQTKKYDESQGIWQSYIEHHTPSAWRIWWVWGPEPNTIIVVSFGPHP